MYPDRKNCRDGFNFSERLTTSRNQEEATYAYATVTVMRQVLTAVVGHRHGYETSVDRCRWPPSLLWDKCWLLSLATVTVMQGHRHWSICAVLRVWEKNSETSEVDMMHNETDVIFLKFLQIYFWNFCYNCMICYVLLQLVMTFAWCWCLFIQVYSSMFDATQQIVVKERFVGLYRGLVPTLIQIAPQTGLQFGFYSMFRSAWISVTAAHTTHQSSSSIGQLHTPSLYSQLASCAMSKIRWDNVACNCWNSFYTWQHICYSAYMLSPVHLSVRASHRWTSQKRLKLGSRNFHHMVAPYSSFSRAAFIPKFWGVPPERGS